MMYSMQSITQSNNELNMNNEGMMLYQTLDEWLEIYKKPNIKKNTYKIYKGTINHIKKYQEDKSFYELTEKEGQMILNKMFDDDYSKSTIVKARTVLNAIFDKAVRNRQISFNPMKYTIVPANAKTKEVRGLTIEEQKKIEEICSQINYGYLFLFLFKTGLRREELKNLKWSDYHSKEGKIKIVKSKTENGVRTVPLISKSKMIIENQERKSDYIFTSKKGNPISNTILKRASKKIREISNIEMFSPHVCRHSFATRAKEKGMDDKALSKILGHANVAFTMQMYVYATDDYIFEQMKVLEAE